MLVSGHPARDRHGNVEDVAGCFKSDYQRRARIGPGPRSATSKALPGPWRRVSISALLKPKSEDCFGQSDGPVFSGCVEMRAQNNHEGGDKQPETYGELHEHLDGRRLAPRLYV